ncbi:MAG: low-specificity L-threonine aldolase [Defluviitaleaceae bacterium]|nr:low-specificity L-threonine aldolase [Defluviitaleaceae bacterium]
MKRLYKNIDLRSDTVTMPTEEMRKAMAEAEVGDDVYKNDPTVTKLEKLAANIVGKEAALFTPSGTMANQLAIMTHTTRGQEIILGFHSHIAENEVGGAAIISQVNFKTIDNTNQFISAKEVKERIREDNIHYPETGLICLENALGNGMVLPLENMKEIYETAKEKKIPVHLDGARIFNAALYLGVEAKELAKYTDSLMFCVSKGLSAPIGSLLCGSAEFIEKARKNRKLLGGGMRQAGVIAAAGIIALETMINRLGEDHLNAKILAKGLKDLGFKVDLENVHINMVFFETEENFEQDKFKSYMIENGVVVSGAYSGNINRFVTHSGITREDVETVLKLIEKFDRK